MKIQLSDHFGYRKLIRFTLPSITMMIFTSVYSIIDGLFISNFAGKTAFAAINLIFPPFMILSAIGFMIGTGGTAVVARTMGEGDRPAANRYFSMLVYFTFAVGAVVTVAAELLTPLTARVLGATGQMYEDCVLYGRVTVAALPFFMLQNVFLAFFPAAEKPGLGLAVSVAAGVMNIVLDAFFIVVLKMGLLGAALGTALSQCAGAVIPLIYFSRPNRSLLRLGKTRFYGKVLKESCLNGISEMVGNISASFVTILYNAQLMRYSGENGIAAYGVAAYLAFVFSAVGIGYAQGAAPVVSYHYGAANKPELGNLLRKSIVLLAVSGVGMTVISYLISPFVAKIFVGYDRELHDLTLYALRIYSFSFMLAGLCIFGSAFFTALGNGRVSAVLSFLRIFLFEAGCVLLLPLILGMDGIWFALIVAEILSLITSAVVLKLNRERYGY